MSDAKNILSLIESVDPSDTAKLDEIDRAVDNYLSNSGSVLSKQYTRSRDALKAIRPEGCVLSIQTSGTCAIWYKSNPFHADSNFVGEGKTEELAELHAIIQAIDYERSQDKP